MSPDHKQKQRRGGLMHRGRPKTDSHRAALSLAARLHVAVAGKTYRDGSPYVPGISQNNKGWFLVHCCGYRGCRKTLAQAIELLEASA